MSSRIISDIKYDTHGYITFGGSANAYTVNTAQPIVGYFNGLRICGRANHTNTGAATLNANSNGAVSIVKAGNTVLAGGEIVSGDCGDYVYDAANNVFQIIGTLATLSTLGISSFAKTLLDDADAATARATMGVGHLIALIEDQKSTGTNAGTFTSGDYRIRDLNTFVYNLADIVTLNSNRFTLPAGTWRISWSAPAYIVNTHQTILYNYSDSNVVSRGSSAHSSSSYYAETRSVGATVVTIAAPKIFEIMHICTTTAATTGFGVACGFGTEMYTQVEIWSV
jgi:hypothetical protein